MKKWIYQPVVFLILIIASQTHFDAHSAMSQYVTIKGSIQKISPSLIEVKTNSGSVFVPRANFDKTASLRPGHPVSVQVAMDEIIEINHAIKGKN